MSAKATLLAVGYYNAAVEHETKHHHDDALQGFMEAARVAKAFLTPKHSLSVLLMEERDSCARGHPRSLAARHILTEVTNDVQDKLRRNRVKLRDAFGAFDTNGDGVLDREEFVEGLRRMDVGLTEQQVQDLVQAVDSDGSGGIDFQARLPPPLLGRPESFKVRA